MEVAESGRHEGGLDLMYMSQTIQSLLTLPL